MKIIIINGPNLNLLGSREPDIYGSLDYNQLCEYIRENAQSMGIKVDFVQSNSESAIIDAIQHSKDEYHGIIINPGAFAHYSYAICDALFSVNIPAVEVHISNIYKREEFRHKSVTVPACKGQVSGLGFYSYVAALGFLKELFQKGKA